MNRNLNKQSLDSLCASLAYAMGIDAPETAAYVFLNTQTVNGGRHLERYQSIGIT